MDWEQLQQSAVNAASRRIVGWRSSAPSMPDAFVESVFSYGAVSIDPRHLVVWVLLGGDHAERVPPWTHADGVGLPRPGIEPDVEEWLRELARVVRHCFTEVAWPDPDGFSVLVDASSRVGSDGWNYFH